MANISIQRYLNLAAHVGKYAWTSLFCLKQSGFQYNRGNTFAVFAQPRGGSTWFTELLKTIPFTAKIDGPLYRGEFFTDGRMPGKGGKIKRLDTLGFYYHQPIPEEAGFEEANSFFEDLFNHRFATPYIYQETSLTKLLCARHYIFKFYQGNLLLQWLVKNFDVTSVVLLRNPYAVIASQLSFYEGRKSMLVGKYEIPSFRHSEVLGSYQSILNDLSRPEELLAARYCMNYLPIIESPDNNKHWITISYEGLLVNGEKEVANLFARLKKAVPEKALKYLKFPSVSTTKIRDDFEDPWMQLTAWERTLSGQQIDRVNSVLDRFKIAGYSRDPLPDFDYIYNR